MKFFSTRQRPAYQGPYPDERLARVDRVDLSSVPAQKALTFENVDHPESLSNAMALSIAMMDTIRDGEINAQLADIPSDHTERTRNAKGFAFFHDAAMVGICKIPASARLATPLSNPAIETLSAQLADGQIKSLASGIDAIIAQLRRTLDAPNVAPLDHTHAIVLLYDSPRDPTIDEPGGKWIYSCNAHRGALRAAETAMVMANYYRLLGYSSRAHSATTCDVDLNQLGVASGLLHVHKEQVVNPFLGQAFGIAAVTTSLALATDQPLAPNASAKGVAWHLGYGTERRKATARSFATRQFCDGALPFENLKRRDQPTTFIDEPRVPRVPKRTDMFPRAQFGDFGKKVQDASINGHMMAKNATGWASRAALGAFIYLQDGDVAPSIAPHAKDPTRNAEHVKAAAYFLGVDAVGLSRCPEWAYYSHDAIGNVIEPYHSNAITLMIDQGRDSMEGSSGDDWLSSAQSMRAYLRGSVLAGVVAAQIRAQGYSARVHSVVDGEVLQPPLSLLSGLGEVSRIGEVILHPLLGPRLKTTVVTTDMPFDYDQPLDFGLQKFCERCNKCARECPSGAITAGPKTMFNGYEIWKSDSQKCISYRLTNAAGSMCGRCMKTCPWNLEGLFAEAPFRWAASNVPKLAPWLAKLDDRLGHGRINPVKKWWWDLDRPDNQSAYHISGESQHRELQPELDLKHEDQTLAVYPANLAPHPWPYPFPVDREAGIKAYRAMLSPAEHKARLARGEVDALTAPYTADQGDSPVLRLQVTAAHRQSDLITRFVLQDPSGAQLPPFTAGAHLDVVVAPEYFRQYSLCNNPAQRDRYVIAVQEESEGRGGSRLLKQLFDVGRNVFVSKPINHFPLVETASRTRLFAGGIGVTPLLAMAHRLHTLERDFQLHYSFAGTDRAAFIEDLSAVPWASNVILHDTRNSGRADLHALLGNFATDEHVYVCGPDQYMAAVIDAAHSNAWPADAVHAEYFAVPDQPLQEKYPFTLRLTQSNKTIDVAEGQAATDALEAAGIPVTVKCSDGLCGVCRCTLIRGDVDHRDFVLSEEQRKQFVILCQSRAAESGGEIEIDL